jgi:hypothetical protein
VNYAANIPALALARGVTALTGFDSAEEQIRAEMADTHEAVANMVDFLVNKGGAGTLYEAAIATTVGVMEGEPAAIANTVEFVAGMYNGPKAPRGLGAAHGPDAPRLTGEAGPAIRSVTDTKPRVAHEKNIGALEPSASATVKQDVGISNAGRELIYLMMDQKTNPSRWDDAVKKARVEGNAPITTSAKQQVMPKQRAGTCVLGAVENALQGERAAKLMTKIDVLRAVQSEAKAHIRQATSSKGYRMDRGVSGYYPRRSMKGGSDLGSDEVMRIMMKLPAFLGMEHRLVHPEFFVEHMKRTGKPIVIIIDTGGGRHAITVSEAVQFEGKTLYKILDTNNSTPQVAGMSAADALAGRAQKFNLLEHDDLLKIIDGYGHSFEGAAKKPPKPWPRHRAPPPADDALDFTK